MMTTTNFGNYAVSYHCKVDIIYNFLSLQTCEMDLKTNHCKRCCHWVLLICRHWRLWGQIKFNLWLPFSDDWMGGLLPFCLSLFLFFLGGGGIFIFCGGVRDLGTERSELSSSRTLYFWFTPLPYPFQSGSHILVLRFHSIILMCTSPYFFQFSSLFKSHIAIEFLPTNS